MPWRTAMRIWLERTQAIEKLSESHFMRRAAQLTVYALLKSKEIGKNTIKQAMESPTTKRLEDNGEQVVSKVQSFAKRLTKELKEGFEDAQKQSGNSKRR